MVALVCVVLAWLQNPAPITAGEAVRAAERAFAEAGLADVTVDDSPSRGAFRGEGRARVAVWKTTATLEGGTVELWVARADGSLVFLDDRTADGANQLLTDEQFDELQAYDENPAVPRQVRRNVALTIGAALVAGMGWWLAAHTTHTGRGPAPPPAAAAAAAAAVAPRPTPRRTRPLRAS